MSSPRRHIPVRSLAELRGKKVTVMGLGTKGGGVEVAKFFLRHRADVTVTDLKAERELAGSLKELSGTPAKIILGVHRDEDFVDADIVIPNPAVPQNSPYLQRAIAAGTSVVTDIALFFAFCPAPIAGITGTRGKTTTTTIAGEILKRDRPDTVVAGNIQRSPLADLDRIRPKTPVILELSSSQLEGLIPLKRSPHWAVYTTLLPDHLNRYDSFEEYARMKETIFRFQTEEDVLLLPVDDVRVAAYAERARGRVFWFGILPHNGEDTPDAGLLKNGMDILRVRGGKQESFMRWEELSGRGDHTKRNFLAGAALALEMGAHPESVKAVLSTFQGVPHRLEVVRMVDGRTYVNDTAGTTPEAVIAGIRAFPDHRLVLITGGTDKGLDYEALAHELSDPRIAHLILLDGSATNKLRQLLKKSRFSESPVVRTMEDAVRAARERALPGDLVLMSPGAASFELFRDEFDRGDQFRAAVVTLPTTTGGRHRDEQGPASGGEGSAKAGAQTEAR